MDSTQQTVGFPQVGTSSVSDGSSAALVASASSGLSPSASDSSPEANGSNGRRSKYTWMSAPAQWRKLYEAWRHKGERLHWKSKRSKPTRGDADAGGLTFHEYQTIRRDPEFWRWWGDQEELAVEELYARCAGAKRDLMECAEGLTKLDPIRLAAIREVLAGVDPEWGKKKVEVQITDPREAKAVEATVNILLGVLKGPPGAPQTHDLPAPSGLGQDDEDIEF